MHRWLVVLSIFLVGAASVTTAGIAVMSGPRAWAGDAPIGHIGDTLRVDTGNYIADVTVSSVQPCDPPPGFGYTRSGVPVKSFPGSTVDRADVTIHAVQVPNSFIMATNFSFDGVTPFADAYKPRTSDAPDALDNVLVNAPQRIDRPRRSLLGRLPRSGLQRRSAGQEDGPAPRAMEPLTLASISPRRIPSTPKSWPPLPRALFRWRVRPRLAAENIASFIDANLSATRFAEYLADPQRAILTAQQDGRIVGYAMLIRGVDDDADVQRAVEIRPLLSCRRCTCCPSITVPAWSTALMERTLAIAAEWGVRCVWLGVNQENQRAQRFYIKSGFKVNGTRTFQVGARREDDYVMVRELR